MIRLDTDYVNRGTDYKGSDRGEASLILKHRRDKFLKQKVSREQLVTELPERLDFVGDLPTIRGHKVDGIPIGSLVYVHYRRFRDNDEEYRLARVQTCGEHTMRVMFIATGEVRGGIDREAVWIPLGV